MNNTKTCRFAAANKIRAAHLPMGQTFEGGSTTIPAGQEFHGKLEPRCEGGSTTIPAGQEFHTPGEESDGEDALADGHPAVPSRGS